MVALPSFTVTGNVFDLLGNIAGGEIVGNGLGGAVPATVTFTSNVPSDAFVRWDGELYRVAEVVATVNGSGEILRNGDPVQLLANDAGLSVENLQWEVHAGSTRRFWFDAPADGDTLDVGAVAPVPAVSLVGLASLPVSGLTDATTFMKGFLTDVDDAAEARTLIGVSLLTLEDIVWYANTAAFPGTGVADEVYGARDTGKLYLWTGASYVAARASVTAADIIDSTASGRAVVTGTPTEARVAIRAADEAASGAMRALMSKLVEGVADATIVINSDSTGATSTGWVIQTAQWLADQFPAYTVNYYLWDDGTDAWPVSADVLQTGTGSYILTVWNAGVGGSSTGHFQGSRFPNLIQNADLVMINHGFNQSGPVDSDTLRQYRRNQYLAFADEFAQANPNAGVVLIGQPPDGRTGREEWQAQKNIQYARAAGWRGWGFINVHRAWIEYGDWQTDLTLGDQVHPTVAGAALWAGLVQAAMERAIRVPVVTQPPVGQPSVQLFPNPLISAWPGTLPIGVTAAHNCTLSKELTDYETGMQAMKITSTSTSGFAYIDMTGTAAQWGINGRLANTTYTAAVRLKVPASNTATVRLALLDNNGVGGTNATDVTASPDARDRYIWVYCTKRFPSNATSLILWIVARTSGTAIVTVTVDQILLFPGPIPNTGYDAVAARVEPLFIDVAASPYNVTPVTTNPEVGIQQAINDANTNGIPEVIISTPGTYTVDLHTIPGQSFYAAAIYAQSNVKLTMKPGVIIKLKNSATLPGGATSGQIIGGDTTLKSNWSVEGGIVDGNATNQSSQAVDSGVSLNRCRSSIVKNVVVKGVYGTASSPPGETLHFEATKCRDVHFVGCEADGSTSANTATGFSTNHSFGVAWTDCVGHEMGFGMGFTNWMSAGLTYDNCRAYLNGHSGFNAELSEDVAYSSCIAGGRSPLITGTTENPYFPSGQIELGNVNGFNIHGCTDVVASACVSTYNTNNLKVYTNSGVSPAVISTRVLITGCELRQATGTNVYVEQAAEGGSAEDQVEVTILDCRGGSNTDIDYIYNLAKAPIIHYRYTGTSGVRYLAQAGVAGPGAFGFRWLPNGFTGPLAGFASMGLNTSGQLATVGRQLYRNPVAVDTTVALANEIVSVTDTSAARTITLPDAATAGSGATFTVKDESGGAATHNITIVRAGSNTIEGATSKVISANYGWVRVMSTGAAWIVLADFSTNALTGKSIDLATNTVTGTTAQFNTALSDANFATLDANSNLAADAFIASETSTATAAGTTTLTIDSTQTQVFTGSTTQNVTLPTTSVIAGQRYTIVNQSSGNVTVQSSGANAIAVVGPGFTGVFFAQVDTPTTAANWQAFAPYTFAASSTLAMRDSRANLLADAFIPSQTSTATAAGTTTLTIDSKQTQVFTGSTTQTVKLPTTSVIAGQSYTIINQSSGVVTVQSSDASFIMAVSPNKVGVFYAVIDTPTTATNWLPGGPTTPRVLALSGSGVATPTINTDLYDVVDITSQSVSITSMTSGTTGTPVSGQQLRIAITATGTKTITWGSLFEDSSTATIPVSVGTSRLDMRFIWNATTSKWRFADERDATSTTAVVGVGSIELGHATDSTITRLSAGQLAVEGNPLGTKVAVPATSSSTGVVGQWAADSTFAYFCTAANTWVRATAATW